MYQQATEREKKASPFSSRFLSRRRLAHHYNTRVNILLGACPASHNHALSWLFRIRLFDRAPMCKQQKRGATPTPHLGPFRRSETLGPCVRR